MTDNLTCHAGDIVLLRPEIIGLESEGPDVRAKTGSGRATWLLGANCSSRPDRAWL